MKSQEVRLLDIFVLGPFMVWYAAQKTTPPWAKAVMGLSGIATILYNGRNYLRASGELGEYFDPMIDSDSLGTVYTTKTNTTVSSRIRPALDLETLAQEISALEALPDIAAEPKARALYWSVRGRLDDPWLMARLVKVARLGRKV